SMVWTQFSSDANVNDAQCYTAGLGANCTLHACRTSCDKSPACNTTIYSTVLKGCILRFCSTSSPKTRTFRNAGLTAWIRKSEG
ncbi:unnamed protein product, partial [Adineta steineri]